jgi:predicted ATPase/DNA-binding winged helix-turn-helix (wHTH) protein
MAQAHTLTFDDFRLEAMPDRLWRGNTVIALRPRSLAVLRYLVEHAGRPVTKAELRQHVWEGTHVTDTVLRVCVQEIRAALGDTAEAPQYLETVARQGYRFLVAGDGETPPPLQAGPIVGRQQDVARLEAWFQCAVQGTRQLVFVSGDVGIGKTTVIDQFLAYCIAGRGIRTGRGQCVEHYGEGEPYLSLLEALGRLGQGPERDAILAVLRRYAPMWLVQLPGLVSETELEWLQRQVEGAPPTRMLRELAQALEVLAADMPLVLVLEDLQWSDRSTVELLAYLAQRREPARLLVLGTYRPVDVVLRAHPLHDMLREFYGRGQVRELPLELLTTEDVATYMTGRLRGPVAAPLAVFVHERTDGNALFLVNLVEHLVQQRLLARRAGQWTLREGVEPTVVGLSEEVRQLITRRLDALPLAARRVLEVASVVGQKFAVAAVAAGAQSPVADVEAVCDELAAQSGFITDNGLTVWPDGTRGGSYRFRHVLYQEVLYEGLGLTRRMQFHRRIGARLEAGYGAHAREVATQLAVHFERGGETAQAIHYMQQAGEHAARRNAPYEAVVIFTKGLELLATLPESPERDQYEIALQLALAEGLIPIKGRVSPEVHAAYTRAYVLCQQVGETPQIFRALWGLVQFHGVRAQLRTAGELSQQLYDLASLQPDTAFMLEGHLAMGRTALYRGDLITGREHLEQSLRLSASRQSSTPTFKGGFVSEVSSLTWLAQAFAVLGYADQAQQRSQEALSLARQAGHTLSLVYAELYAAMISQIRRDIVATQAHADLAVTLAAAEDAAIRVEQGRIWRGWALAMRGDAPAGVAHLHQGLRALQDTGLKLYRPYFLALLAEASGQAGQPAAGLQALAEAVTLMTTTEGRWWEAEVYRLQGTLLLQLPNPDVPRAEACFQQALKVARGQRAKSLELRAAMSLCRLWQQSKRDTASQLLTGVYGGFTEGFDAPDLQEARALLGALQ